MGVRCSAAKHRVTSKTHVYGNFEFKSEIRVTKQCDIKFPGENFVNFSARLGGQDTRRREYERPLWRVGQEDG
eukprot:1395031-Amorphochlora_amoeboformis.AAC.4